MNLRVASWCRDLLRGPHVVPASRRPWVVGSAIVAYCLLVRPLYPFVGPAVGVFGIIPVAFAVTCYGRRGALLPPVLGVITPALFPQLPTELAGPTLATLAVTLAAWLLGYVAEQGTRATRHAYELQVATETDALTTLANRKGLFRIVSERITREPSAPLTLLIAEPLDLWEALDSFGDEIEPELMRKLARRVVTETPNALVARAEHTSSFVVVLDGATRVPTDLGQRLLSALRAAVTVGDATVYLDWRIGAATYPTNARSARRLFQRAEGAIAAAGDLAADVAQAEAAQRDSARTMTWELRRALVHRELTLDFQPVVALATREVPLVEALARWTHPTRGAVSPAEFIPIAERSGLIRPLTDAVLAEALHWCAMWDGALAVAVNMSARVLQDPTLPSRVARALCDAGVKPTMLIAEITESALLSERAIAVVGALRALGVRIAVDDFGTGFSSLSYLARLQLDSLKLDRSFIQRIDEPATNAVIRASIQLGHALALDVVAEGVEHQADIERLAEFGCDYVQGYAFARPMCAALVAPWLAEYRQRVANGV